MSVTIDTAAPVAPTITSFTPDSGTIGDGITNSSTLTLAGSAEANSTVKIYDGATLLGSATTNGAGAWSYATASLGNGAHNFTATATDAAGNVSTASGPTVVTIDTHVPAVAETLFNDTGSSSIDKLTSNPTLTGSGDANAVVHFTVDGTPVATTATANSARHLDLYPDRPCRRRPYNRRQRNRHGRHDGHQHHHVHARYHRARCLRDNVDALERD